MAVFQKFKSLNMKYSRWAPKGIILLRTTFIGVFCVKIRLEVLAVDCSKDPKTKKKLVH